MYLRVDKKEKKGKGMCDVTEGLVALETEVVPASELQHPEDVFML